MTLTHNENITFSIPGKAFIAGEYLALKGGAALTAAVGPRFSLEVKPRKHEIQNPFHPHSPAGKFWEQKKDFFQNFDFHFSDSHQGQGGWGGSTAEFGLLYSFYQWSIEEKEEMDFDMKKLLDDYQNLSDVGGIYKPSGADLVGQISGELTYFDRKLGKLESFEWPFGDVENGSGIGFLLARSGSKLSTHEHLKQLKEFDSKELSLQMGKIYSGLLKRNSQEFIEGIRGYACELQRLGFVAPQTLNILNKINDQIVLAKKGCGALGADVICVFFFEKNRAQVITQLEDIGLKVVASNLSLEPGIQGDLI